MKIYDRLIKTVITMYKDGATSRDIQRETGAPIRSIERWLKPERDRQKRMIRDEVRDMLGQGATQAVIARRFKVSQATIYNWIKAWGFRTMVENNYRQANKKIKTGY